MKIFFALSITLFLTGCNPFSDFKPDSVDIVRRGWAKNITKEAPPPVYCYKTIGDTICYSAPIEGKENRLSGSYEHNETIHDDVSWLEELRTSLNKTQTE